jgi:adenosylhomocysteine nucleosidase
MWLASAVRCWLFCHAEGMNTPVLIMSALPGELASLQEQTSDGATITFGGHDFLTGTIDSRDVVVVAAGIGKVKAAMVATLAIDHFSPGALIFTGVAGGIDDTLGIGDVVVAEHVLHHDTGVLEPDGFRLYQSGHVPFLNPTEQLGYRPSDELLGRVRPRLADLELSPVLQRQPDIVFGTVVTGDQFLQSDVHRRRLHATLQAHAVEMEGAAVAQVAEHFGVDHLVIRAVSDLAGSDSSFDFARFLDDVTINSTAVVVAVLDAI